MPASKTIADKTLEDASRPFLIARFLSWSFFFLLLGSSLALSFFIASRARETALDKQRQFALLLAENLNHQIYRGFWLPTLIGFGRIDLTEKAQYDRLDQIVRSTIHSFRVLDIRIHGAESGVVYSTNPEILGKTGLSGDSVTQALDEGRFSFEILSRAPEFPLRPVLDMPPETVVMRTVYPLRADFLRERRPGAPPLQDKGPILGALEIKQDITEDYETVVQFQFIIIAASCTTALVLFFVILAILRHADRVNRDRLDERGRLERQLAQSEKLASMGRVVASIAHEIRNPLGIIRSSAELLLRQPPGAAEAPAPNSPEGRRRRIIQAIFDEAVRLSRTVGDFLDYARPRNPRMEPLDLAQTFDQLLVFFERECESRKIAVERAYPASLAILGDKDLLYRAFYNLVSNGLQATPDGGRMRIEAAEEKGHVRVSVHDSGPGFDPTSREKALDPFYTTKDHGTGLGLAIVGGILQAHNAQIALGDSPLGGARVDVTFPDGQ